MATITFPVFTVPMLVTILLPPVLRSNISVTLLLKLTNTPAFSAILNRPEKNLPG